MLRRRGCGNLDRSLELTASRVNISSPRTPHKRQDAGIPQYLLKLRHTCVFGSFKIEFGSWIERDQIDSSFDSAEQLHDLLRVLAQIVHFVQQDIFKRHPLPVSQRE